MGDSGIFSEKINWRYALLAVGFAAIAVYRLREGDAVWATVFALAVLANGCLALGFVPGVGRPSGRGTKAADETDHPPPGADQAERMRKTLAVYSSRMRTWAVISIGGWTVAVAGALFFPPLGLVASVLALFTTLRYLRFRRSVAILRRALGDAD